MDDVPLRFFGVACAKITTVVVARQTARNARSTCDDGLDGVDEVWTSANLPRRMAAG
jgi:hypothetical protein